jgi:hypothetical protein
MRPLPALLIGGLIGLGLGMGLSMWRQRSSEKSVMRHYEARLGCKDFAAKYVHDHDPSLQIDSSDFSPARNACLVSVSKIVTDRSCKEYRIINLSLGDDIFSRSSCDQSKANVETAERMQESRDRCFEHALRERSNCE